MYTYILLEHYLETVKYMMITKRYYIKCNDIKTYMDSPKIHQISHQLWRHILKWRCHFLQFWEELTHKLILHKSNISKTYGTVLSLSKNNSQVEAYNSSQNENHWQGNLLKHHTRSTEHSVLYLQFSTMQDTV